VEEEMTSNNPSQGGIRLVRRSPEETATYLSTKLAEAMATEQASFKRWEAAEVYIKELTHHHEALLTTLGASTHGWIKKVHKNVWAAYEILRRRRP
jgi:hypothetical protein